MALSKLIIGSTRQTRLKAGIDDNNFVRVQDLNSLIEDINTEVIGGLTGTYKALLTQTGTDAPTATVLVNTLGITPVFARSGTGQYTITSTGSFPSGRTAITTGQYYINGIGQITYAYRNSDNEIAVETAEHNPVGPTFDNIDEGLDQTVVCIEVY